MKNKEKTIYGVVTKLVDPGIPGLDMKMREIKRLKGLIGASPQLSPTGNNSYTLWFFNSMKNADDAIVKFISLKLGPEKAVHKFSYDGKTVTDYLGTKFDEIDVTFNADSMQAAGGKNND